MLGSVCVEDVRRFSRHSGCVSYILPTNTAVFPAVTVWNASHQPIAGMPDLQTIISMV